jgi:NitT/TauT family transport system permease protein
MAQVFVPDDPRVREQIQNGRTGADFKEIPPGRSRGPRRFGLIDLVVFLVVIAAISFIVAAATRWAAPLTPAVKIDLSPAVLPLYAGYSLLRMLLGYLLSLVFTNHSNSCIWVSLASNRHTARSIGLMGRFNERNRVASE